MPDFGAMIMRMGVAILYAFQQSVLFCGRVCSPAADGARMYAVTCHRVSFRTLVSCATVIGARLGATDTTA